MVIKKLALNNCSATNKPWQQHFSLTDLYNSIYLAQEISKLVSDLNIT